MTKIEFENILSEINNLDKVQNAALLNFLEKLSDEFEITKQTNISSTHHLDAVEELYNKILNHYKKRING